MRRRLADESLNGNLMGGLAGNRAWWLGIAFAAFAVLMAVGVFAPSQAWAADYKTAGYYVWDGSWHWKTAYAEVLDNIDSDHYTLNHDWYVMTGDWGDGDRPTISGTVNIIIEDGCDVHLRNGLHVPPGTTLNIYGQSSNTGKLKVAKSKRDTAAIGGDREEDSGTINIYGGDLNVHGGSYSDHGGAGIGGGYKGAGVVRIYGGNILAEGGNEGAGIGGGSNKDGSDGYGGDYNDIELWGGNINAIGNWGAGIGGGMHARGGNIKIIGGNITATGGKNSAGIGGGFQKDGGNITIHNGTVTAKGGSVTSNGGAGIGGGGKGGSGTINIVGGTVNASGGVFSAGIGGGDEGEGNGITISGGNVTATGHTQDSNGGGGAAGIGGGDKAAGKHITISGGTVSATGGTKLSVNGGAGIGGGSKGNGEDITIAGTANITKAQGAVDAAGIGGGDGGEGKNIRIEGGTVNAHGGSVKDGGGAGIGGGQKKTGRVTITGGNVTATGGGDGAGIGGGEDGSSNVNISGGTVKANGGVHGAGIGGGQDAGGGVITIGGSAYINAKGGQYGAGIGGGDEGVNAGTIAISGSPYIKAVGGEYAAGIGGGDKGGRQGSVTIAGGEIIAKGGFSGAGIGTGRWSHTHGRDYYTNAVSVTITGGSVNTSGNGCGAGIGGGRMGPSGKIVIGTLGGANQPYVSATGGYDGGAGIGSGTAFAKDDVETVNIEINGGTITARPGEIDASSNNTGADPGAAIGTGGCENDVGPGNIRYESYFIGTIALNGGRITAYGADITKSSGTDKGKLNVIGTTSKENKAWEGKGVVKFNGATVDMYPGTGNNYIKQMVRASATSDGGVQLIDSDTSYQRVTFITQNDNINSNMREAKTDYRRLVLTGAEDIEEYGGTKLEHAEYKHIRVEPQHKHNFTYSVGTTNTTGDTIIAKCSSGSACGLPNNEARLILSKPPHEVYGDGKDAGVVVTDESHIGESRVSYYKANDDGTKASALNESNLYEIPTDAGKYWAEITLGKGSEGGADDTDPTVSTNKATAHVVYAIDKAKPAVVSTAVIDQGNEPKTIDLAANVQNVPSDAYITYSLDESDALSQEGIAMEGSVLRIPAAAMSDSNRDKVVVHVNYAGNDNYYPVNSSINVTINKLPRPTITPDEVTFRYGETGKSVGAVATGDAGETGAITYAVKNTGTGYDFFGGGTGTTGTTGGTGATGDESEWSENDVIKVNKTTGAIEAKKSGTATVTVTVAGNGRYAPTAKDVKVTVRGSEFTGIAVEGYEGVYDGKAHGITVSGVPEDIDAKVYYATTELTDANYQIEGIASDDPLHIDSVYFKDAGERTVYYYVTAPNYEPVKGSANVKISKKPVDATVSAEDKTYDGTADATVSASVSAGLLAEDDSIEIGGISGAFASKNAGENKPVAVDASAVTFSGEGTDNYEVAIPASTTATIEKAFVIVMADDKYVPVNTELPDEYTATSRTPIGLEEIDTEFTCDADVTVPGEYEIEVTADPTTETNSNYDIWCINGTLTVTRPIEVTATGFEGSYDGQPHGISVSVAIPGISLPEIKEADIDSITREQWLVLAELAEFAGLDIIVPSEDWTDAEWELWTYEAKTELKNAVADLKLAEVYYGDEELDEDNVYDAGSTTSPQYTDVGTYRVYYYLTAFDGQKASGSADVVINKAVPTYTPPAPVEGLRYTGEAQTLITAGSVTAGGAMEYSLDGTTWSQDVPSATEVGSYPVLYRVTGNGNYNDVAPTPIIATIAKKLEPGVTLESWTYDSPAKDPVFGDGVNAITTGVTFSYKAKDADDSAYASDKPTQAGEYTVRAEVAASGTSYDGTYTADFSIVPKPLTATVVADDKTYDGTTAATLVAYVDDAKVKDGDSVSISGVTGEFADANAGSMKQVVVDPASATVSGAGSENYAVTIPDSTVATIEKAWAVIMADDVTIAVGQPLPEPLKALSHTTVKEDKLVYTLTCDYEQKVGEYAIEVLLDETVAPNCNYDVTCIPGKLTITKAELTVTAEGYTGTYDGQPHGITVTAQPGAAGAKVYYSAETDLTAENCQTAGTLNNPTFADAGTHRVYYCVVASDYNPVVGFKDVVIAKADPAVTAPTAKQLSYTGGPQELVAPGSAEGGTMEYSLDGTTWSTAVPSATEPAAYSVLYRVTGDANHSDVVPKPVTSTIAKEYDPSSAKAMYRLYNPYSGEHFYTASATERDSLTPLGWRFEGVGWYAPAQGQDVHRLYNPYSGDHHFTTDARERDVCVAAGWRYEGVGWRSGGSTPVFREYNPYADAFYHNYTASSSEHQHLCSIGWKNEGIGWYGV